MARVNNELFHFLLSRNIFKGNAQTGKSSEKTEQKWIEKNRDRLVWLSKGWRTDAITKLTHRTGSGTYIRSKHGELK